MVLFRVNVVLGEHALHIRIQLAAQDFPKLGIIQADLGSAVIQVDNLHANFTGCVQCRQQGFLDDHGFVIRAALPGQCRPIAFISRPFFPGWKRIILVMA